METGKSSNDALRKELSSAFNQKIDNLRQHFESKHPKSPLPAELQEGAAWQLAYLQGIAGGKPEKVTVSQTPQEVIETRSTSLWEQNQNANEEKNEKINAKVNLEPIHDRSYTVNEMKTGEKEDQFEQKLPKKESAKKTKDTKPKNSSEGSKKCKRSSLVAKSKTKRYGCTFETNIDSLH